MNTETRLKRILFRSSHRGTKEADLLLGPYAQKHLATMSETDIVAFEQFLEESDSDIWDWISGATEPTRYHSLIKELRHMTQSNRKDTQT